MLAKVKCTADTKNNNGRNGFLGKNQEKYKYNDFTVT